MLIYNAKPLKLKFSNLLDYKLLAGGFSYRDLYTLPIEDASYNAFMGAWCCILGVENEDDFLDNIDIDKDCENLENLDILFELCEGAKALVRETWLRDCYVKKAETEEKTEPESSKKDAFTNYIELKEFCCQNCNLSRAEFDDLTPRETHFVLEEYKSKQSQKRSILRLFDAHFARLEVGAFGGKVKDFLILGGVSSSAKPISLKEKLDYEMKMNKLRAKRRKMLEEGAKNGK